jgi:hypothetical protein
MKKLATIVASFFLCFSVLPSTKNDSLKFIALGLSPFSFTVGISFTLDKNFITSKNVVYVFQGNLISVVYNQNQTIIVPIERAKTVMYILQNSGSDWKSFFIELAKVGFPTSQKERPQT